MTFKTQPFKHQLDSLELAKDRKYWAHFHEMGAGKTKIVIDNACYLYEKKEIANVIVIAPNGIQNNWAEREIPKHCGVDHNIYCWNGPPMTKKAQRAMNRFLSTDTGLSWLCINIEAIRTRRGMEFCKLFLSSAPTMTVVDESTIIKTPGAKQTKAAIFLGDKSAYRRILTGTPITQGPLDLYSQSKFLGRNSIPFTSYTAFKYAFAIEKSVELNSGKRFNQVVGYKNLDRLKALVEPFSDRILKSECLDLPEKTYQQVRVPLTQEQEKLYRSIKDLCIAQLENEEQTTGMVSAQNALTALIKLQQITTGFVRDDEGLDHKISNHRLPKLVDILEQCAGKAIIWCAFVPNIESVCGELGELYGKDSFVSYYGATPRDERRRAIDQFQADPDCRFFVSNRTGSEGITLTEAAFSIYFSNTYSLHTRLQSEDRNHRIGQDKNVTYIDLFSPGTVDEAVLKCLKGKKDIADTVLKDWRELLT